MVDVKLPQLGMTMTEAEVVTWLATPGDHVDEGVDLVEVESSKARVTIPSPCSGTLTEILVAEGVSADVGTVVARIEPDA